MCATILGQAVVPRVGGRERCTGRPTTSHKHWRCGTTRVCSSGWRSPTLNRSGFAGPNIIATQGTLGLLSGATSIDFREPPQGDVRRTPLLGGWVNNAPTSHRFLIFGDHGEDQHVPKLPVGAYLGVPELALQPVPGALRHPHAAAVQGVAADLDASSAQVLQGEAGDAADR